VHEDESVHDILDTIVNAGVFVYMCASAPPTPARADARASGAATPFALFGSALEDVGPGRLVALAAAVLAFRRLPWVVLLHWVIPALRNWRHGAFVGWCARPCLHARGRSRVRAGSGRSACPPFSTSPYACVPSGGCAPR
jgi:NhaP-type Na+/H+ or K+/H+ antiporter